MTQELRERLYRLVGALAFCLPWTLQVGSNAAMVSISDYYYTGMRDLLTLVLGSIALLLPLTQVGSRSPNGEKTFSIMAAVFLTVFVLFPTLNITLGHVPNDLVINIVPISWSGSLHNLASGGFLSSAAALILFYFPQATKTDSSVRNLVRTFIFVTCGLIIALCIGLIGWQATTAENEFQRDTLSILVPERTALIFLGVAWLVRGRLILR